MSKLRKVTIPGALISCSHCEAELGIEPSFSMMAIVACIAAIGLIKYAEMPSLMYVLGWALVFVSAFFYLAGAKLTIKNIGFKNRMREKDQGL